MLEENGVVMKTWRWLGENFDMLISHLYCLGIAAAGIETHIGRYCPPFSRVRLANPLLLGLLIRISCS